MQVYIQASVTSNKTKLLLLVRVLPYAFERLLVTLRLPSLPFIKTNVAIYNVPQ